MIIGNGMLAEAFNNYKNNNNVLILASGVSNSQEIDMSAFKREQVLLESAIDEQDDKLLVYFSTCSMYDPVAKDTLYVKHKLKMEKLIEDKSKHFLILRVSQILGKSKNNTLVNYLYEHIKHGKHFQVWENSNRNLIALPEVIKISQELIENEKHHNKIYHIANSLYLDITNLVDIFEVVLEKKANYTMIDKGEKYQTIPSDISIITDSLGINFNQDYYYNNLKYFCQDNSS